jgi:hypothetical protein
LSLYRIKKLTGALIVAFVIIKPDPILVRGAGLVDQLASPVEEKIK